MDKLREVAKVTVAKRILAKRVCILTTSTIFPIFRRLDGADYWQTTATLIRLILDVIEYITSQMPFLTDSNVQ